MPRVTHDLFVRDTIPVRGRDEAGAQAVRADRLRQRTSQSRLGGTLQQDLAHRVRNQPDCLDDATSVHLAEQGAG